MAERRLRKFRRGTTLAVAITGLTLLVAGVPETDEADATAPRASAVAASQEPSSQASPPQDSLAEDTARTPDPGESVEEATGTVRQLALEFTALLPKIVIALGLLLAAAAVVRLLRFALRRLLGRWERADAATALTGVVVWLLAIGVALSVIAGDARALVGSVGLLGLALSWALQAPIESFAGWILNSFKGYYRVGDRIAVGDLFGDVYRIDVLNTTVWEAGGPEKPVQGAQPTGALITFPNSEVLRANVTNYTRGFPYVWDEIAIGVANESDIVHAMQVAAAVARRVVGPAMTGPVATYRELLDQEGLAYDVADDPQVYATPTESWVDLTVRYLVPARERRKWASALFLEINAVFAQPEHRARVLSAYPVRRVELHERG